MDPPVQADDRAPRRPVRLRVPGRWSRASGASNARPDARPLHRTHRRWRAVRSRQHPRAVPLEELGQRCAPRERAKGRPGVPTRGFCAPGSPRLPSMYARGRVSRLFGGFASGVMHERRRPRGSGRVRDDGPPRESRTATPLPGLRRRAPVPRWAGQAMPLVRRPPSASLASSPTGGAGGRRARRTAQEAGARRDPAPRPRPGSPVRADVGPRRAMNSRVAWTRPDQIVARGCPMALPAHSVPGRRSPPRRP